MLADNWLRKKSLFSATLVVVDAELVATWFVADDVVLEPAAVLALSCDNNWLSDVPAVLPMFMRKLPQKLALSASQYKKNKDPS
ncbi:hypothetical protein AEAC466_02025 [Asticcacaulis sp. AC466]|nr:hypothetical protein AEAC466_02025 [Asticcacaulis sp. AC466]